MPVMNVSGMKIVAITVRPEISAKEIFPETEYHFDTLRSRLRELAFLNRGVTITLADERGVEPTEGAVEKVLNLAKTTPRLLTEDEVLAAAAD